MARIVHQAHEFGARNLRRRLGKLVAAFHAARAADVAAMAQQQQDLLKIAFRNLFPLANIGGFDKSLAVMLRQIQQR